ncbi:hypothetical protein ACFZDF_33925 [Streptomyces sp. NPDC007910]|uniref:hypothetical protein n=1 Tax=Streptomyces sp. NPDC007910 TaxID=3364790 RepID=UPI0036EF3A59
MTPTVRLPGPAPVAGRRPDAARRWPRGLAIAALHLMRAAGATTGPTTRQAAGRDAGFHVLEAQRFGFAVVAAAGVPGRPARFRVRPVLAAARIAPAATGCWGACLSLVVLLPVTDPADRVTALTRSAYAGDMIAGFLLAACAAALLRRRSAGT